MGVGITGHVSYFHCFHDILGGCLFVNFFPLVESCSCTVMDVNL